MTELVMTPALLERFWAKVDKTPTCWLWTASRAKNGYGKMTTVGSSKAYAHRLSYSIAYGPIPAGMVIDHRCHNKLCVNPEHLQAVTTSQNMQNRSGAATNSRSGVRGVHLEPLTGKWRVQIRARGRNHCGGYYHDLDEAAAAAAELRARLMENSLMDVPSPPSPS